MSRTLHARLVAYRAFGARLGVLPEPVSFDASLLHNDSGALSVEYSALSAGAGLLDGQLTDGLEIALEVSDGTGYVEPDNARFVVTGRSGKTDDRTGTVKYTGQCIQWLLSKAKMLDTTHLLTDGDNKGKRPFYSSNSGTILKTLMDENAARGGVAAGLTLGFDTAKDAGGDGWAKKYTLYYSLGVDLQSALSSLVQGGGCDWRTSRRRLDIYNADSGRLSRDLSKSVILQLGRDISEAPYEESISSLASTILVEGDNSLVFTMDNPAAPHPWGKWEDYVSQGGVSDEATATAFMQAKLSDAARVRGQYTRTVITAGDITSLPLIDYHAGDWITAPTVSHAEKTRVQEIDVSMRQGDGLTVSLALNDVKYDASVRQSKRMQGITGGASLAGSQGGKAASEHDHRVAAAPAGLTAMTTAYLDSTGHARGLATVQWAAVTTATDGTALEIGGYAVEWRTHVDGAPWRAAGTTDKTTLGISPLDCGTTVEIRVRANATYSDQPGAWCTPVVVTVENDATPCSVPSKPVLSSALGVVTIHWDGKTDAGANMEPDFDHVEVGRGTTANDLTPIAATQSGQGDYLDTTRAPGSTWSYALRSVDHTGNRSAWSALAMVTVASTVSHEEIARIDSTLTQARSDIQANTSAISTTKSDLAATNSTLTQARNDITAAQQAASDAKSAAAKAQTSADTLSVQVTQVKDTATKAQATADGKNMIYRGPSEPAHDGLRPGDLWWRTQAYFTRWAGEPDNSESLLADFYTEWAGEPDASESLLVPLIDRVVDVRMWDGTRFDAYNVVAQNVVATGSISTGLLAANAITTDKLAASAVTTDKLAAGSVQTDKLAAGSVTTDRLAANAVTADKLAANSVIAGKLAANSVNAGNLVAGAVTADKLAANAVTADKLAANSVTAAKILAGTITSDKVAAGQFTGYVFTGAVFQSSESADTGIKINSTALQMWDSLHNRTVYLDGEGKNNVLTGSFQTAATGNRIAINSQTTAGIVGSSTSLSGQSITFNDDDFAGQPAIFGYFTNSDLGDAPRIDLCSGWKTDHDPAAMLFLQSWPRTKGATGTGITSTAGMSANTDYTEPDSTKKSYASLDLEGIGGIGAYASLEAYAYAGTKAQTWVTATRNDGVTQVGIGADAFTQSIYLGGKLGGIVGQQTFRTGNWKIFSGTLGAGATLGPATFALAPAKYGVYYAVANADVQWGSIFIHVLNTGSPSQYQVMGYNAGAAYTGGIWVDTIAWLT
ncbi:MAG: hypothetical protein I3I97_02830 [Bifidobacterium thermophilum]|nr:hypothetical protein [Bifidobacterium thermophilum]